MDGQAQEIANRVGASLRNTETALSAGDTATAQTEVSNLHNALRDTFSFLAENTDLDLDWDQIVGNHDATKGMHTDGGGPKTPPSQ